MTRAPEPLRTTLVGDLASELSGWGDPVAFGVGWDGDFYAAARRSNEALTLAVRWLEGESQTVICRGGSLAASFIQPFPGGVLLVGARCHWRPEGPERNAVALDWNGRELGRTGSAPEEVELLLVSPHPPDVLADACSMDHPGADGRLPALDADVADTRDVCRIHGTVVARMLASSASLLGPGAPRRLGTPG